MAFGKSFPKWMRGRKHLARLPVRGLVQPGGYNLVEPRCETDGRPHRKRGCDEILLSFIPLLLIHVAVEELTPSSCVTPALCRHEVSDERELQKVAMPN